MSGARLFDSPAPIPGQVGLEAESPEAGAAWEVERADVGFARCSTGSGGAAVPDRLDAGALSVARARLAPRVDRALASAVVDARAALDPSYARRVEREQAYRENFGARKERDGRSSGWHHGQPQCPSCRRILNQAGGWCPNCRTVGGRHDHGR